MANNFRGYCFLPHTVCGTHVRAVRVKYDDDLPKYMVGLTSWNGKSKLRCLCESQATASFSRCAGSDRDTTAWLMEPPSIPMIRTHCSFTCSSCTVCDLSFIWHENSLATVWRSIVTWLHARIITAVLNLQLKPMGHNFAETTILFMELEMRNFQRSKTSTGGFAKKCKIWVWGWIWTSVTKIPILKT